VNKNAVVGIAVGLAILVFVAMTLMTRPNIPMEQGRPVATSESYNPLAEPMVAHMIEVEKVGFGAASGSDVRVTWEKDHLHLTLSDPFLKSLGEGAIGKLGLVDRESDITREQYTHFLENLHDLLEVLHPDAHEHDKTEHP
jgi:hypothetical protein